MTEVENRMQEIDNYYKVDRATGEVVDEKALSTYLRQPNSEEMVEASGLTALMQSEPPRYIQELSNLNLPDEEKLEVLSLYEGSTWVPFTKYINQDVTLLGAIVWHHAPYMSKEVKDARGNVLAESQHMPGYDKILMLTDKTDTDGMPICIATSASTLGNHVYAILRTNGWFIWDNPATYRFRQEEPGKPFTMINVERASLLLAKLKKGSAKK